ncbi:MAG: LysM peptidoglycan-binding domain-containing protein [Bacilli bacterium]|nr:LysM peptidoglycan-binding domain-containing protein [Bacilli bacterium]
MNNNLLGIVIDPGHGGDDSGAQGINNLEKDYNLKISKYMYERFKELGVPVTITRDTDETLTPTDRVNKILKAYGNDPNVIVISNHLNSGGGNGAEVIYALRNPSTLAQSILDNIKKTGQNTRRIYQKRLPSDTSKDYYFIHRNTGNTEPLIIEYGFIDNKDNINFLNKNYKELAEAVIKAILNYKGIPYIPPKTNQSNSSYNVRKGDTLYSIANKYNTTVDEIKRLNNLTSNQLSIGQLLKLPTINLEDTYIIKKGDSLYSIANKYNTTVNKLKQLNNLNSNTLSIGQTLLIPSGEIIEDIMTDNEFYTIKSGDTIYSIARLYNTTIDEIKTINNLTSNLVSVGQTIKLPTSNITTSYIVEKGDTLYSIANKFNTTVDKLKILNNLTTNNLKIGQELLINK